MINQATFMFFVVDAAGDTRKTRVIATFNALGVPADFEFRDYDTDAVISVPVDLKLRQQLELAVFEMTASG